MYDCNRYLELISGAVDGVLTPEEERRLQEHLAGCEACRTLLEEWRAVSREMGEMEEPAPEGLLSRVMEQVEQTTQDPPLTNLPQGARPDRQQARRQLTAWWKPLLRTGALAACVVLIFGAGIWLRGFFGAGSSGTAQDTAASTAGSAADADTAVNESASAEGALDDAAPEMDAGSAAPGEPAGAEDRSESGEEASAGTGGTKEDWTALLEERGLAPLSDEAPCGVLVIPAEQAEEETLTAQDWMVLREELADSDAVFWAADGAPEAELGWVYWITD